MERREFREYVVTSFHKIITQAPNLDPQNLRDSACDVTWKYRYYYVISGNEQCRRDSLTSSCKHISCGNNIKSIDISSTELNFNTSSNRDSIMATVSFWFLFVLLPSLIAKSFSSGEIVFNIDNVQLSYATALPNSKDFA